MVSETQIIQAETRLQDDILLFLAQEIVPDKNVQLGVEKSLPHSALEQEVVANDFYIDLRLDDIRIAAKILKGRKTVPGVRLIIIPATRQVYRDALKEGPIDIFMDAEAVVSTPTCGPCLGGYMGILAEGERAISTTNRNFVGRMGHPKSEVYLSSPAVAAASAVLGRIAHPDEL